jgi:hypothetical protein
MAILRQSQSFTAKRPDGTVVTLFVFTKSNDASKLDAFAEAPTERSIRTQQGQVVNYLDRGRYQIQGDNDVLVSSDPAAP